MPGIAYSITITRASAFEQSYDIYARPGAPPVEVDDGIYCGNFPILPGQTSITASVTVPALGTWYAHIVPVCNGKYGLPSVAIL